MFLSIKRKFSNAILNTVILITFVFCCYLAKQVGAVEINKKYISIYIQVAELYLLYQKAARLQSYLDDINQLLTNTENLRAGADSLNDQFSRAKTAVKSSLSIDLQHES